MAEDEWNTTNNGGAQNNYGFNNSGWNEPNATINYTTQPTYVTVASRQQPPPPPTRQSTSPKKEGFSTLFVAETHFPSWED